LHIEAYHSQINNRKEENKQHTKIPKGNLRKKTGRKIKENSYFIKRKKRKTLTFHQHEGLTKNLEKS